ncbi:MAG TPA: isoprenylcysteine carboxylmethyltransferase family protein [Burkholderiales bacterium]|nr:isoprenylcysteine carboxylmethyltransferase family protein [Burkholderiales bacterium]
MPPAAVLAAFGAVMWLVAIVLPVLDLDFPARMEVMAGAIAAALIVGLAAVAGFRRAHTTVNPMTPQAASALVTGGIYRFTRNPMYLAMLILLGGWCYVVANGAALAMLPLFVAYLNRFQIQPEERALAARFGAEFERYRARVRRWL